MAETDPKETPDPNPNPADPAPGNILGEDPNKPAEPDPKPADPAPGDSPAEEPIKYELKLPEGVELSLDDFTKVAGEHKLPPEAAQSLVDMHVKALESAGEAAGKAWNDMQTTWQTQVKADPELGGDNLASMKVTVAKAIEQFSGDPNAVREALVLTGAGNNPAIIRTFYRMAKQLTEGGHIKGEPSQNQPKSAAQALYPNLPSAAA